MFFLKAARKYTMVKMLSPTVSRMMHSRAMQAIAEHCYIKEEEFEDILEECDNEDNVIFLDVRENGAKMKTQIPDWNRNTKLKKINLPLFDVNEHELDPIEEFRDTHTILCYSKHGDDACEAYQYLKKYGYNAKSVELDLKDFIRSHYF